MQKKKDIDPMYEYQKKNRVKVRHALNKNQDKKEEGEEKIMKTQRRRKKEDKEKRVKKTIGKQKQNNTFFLTSWALCSVCFQKNPKNNIFLIYMYLVK